ncbi:hypothetical protein EGI31_20570 [Lacihabitans soyangensis]|uniref:Uncharacterized protein n=2 Tax=Lacihabitans soyangensis TaxID=869394 RepID=A0AAE3H717_9BACT|nr:hypothetical protein [Lacihabitans soyangensis]
MKRIWKNQYSYESVGNYVFKISLREFKKMAVGLGLPTLTARAVILQWEQKYQSKTFQAIKRKLNDLFMRFNNNSLSAFIDYSL